jgi:hypothetical protein
VLFSRGCIIGRLRLVEIARTKATMARKCSLNLGQLASELSKGSIIDLQARQFELRLLLWSGCELHRQYCMARGYVTFVSVVGTTD